MIRSTKILYECLFNINRDSLFNIDRDSAISWLEYIEIIWLPFNSRETVPMSYNLLYISDKLSYLQTQLLDSLMPRILEKMGHGGHKHTCCCCYCSVASVMSDSVWPYRRQPTRVPVVFYCIQLSRKYHASTYSIKCGSNTTHLHKRHHLFEDVHLDMTVLSVIMPTILSDRIW